MEWIFLSMLWYETKSSSSSQKIERKSLEFLTDLTFDTNHQQFDKTVHVQLNVIVNLPNVDIWFYFRLIILVVNIICTATL